jgi:hypothetical protein
MNTPSDLQDAAVEMANALRRAAKRQESTHGLGWGSTNPADEVPPMNMGIAKCRISLKLLFS